MDSGRFFFNFVTLIFVSLTVVVLVIVLAVAAGSMDSPIWAANETEAPLPTLLPTNTPIMGIPTLTPSAAAPVMETPPATEMAEE